VIRIDSALPAPVAERDAMPLGDPRTITYVRVSVTDRCNLRCRYCMPEDQDFLEGSHLLGFDEILAVVSVLVRHGVNKVRLTGGEPLLRKDLARLVARIKALPGTPEVVMTTNAMLLSRYARDLADAGLDRLNVSLDTLREERFELLARRRGLAETLAGLDAAADAGLTRTKLNTVVMGGVNDDEIGDLLAFSAARGIHQRFIEFMPMRSNGYGLDAARVPLDVIRARLEEVGPLRSVGRGSGPAEDFVIETTGQKVGIIAAISQPFCESCNRVRLTAEGVLRSCLFEGGEIDVRQLLAGADSEGALVEALEYLRRVKPPVHDGYGHAQMNRMGG